MHCINLEYTDGYYLLISALDKFCHLENLWANGIWYLSSELFSLILFNGNIMALILIVFMLQFTYYIDLYMCYFL